MALPVPSKKSGSRSSTGYKKTSRKCGPKVKSGCRTCKIRRVKCDEKKPACQKCSSTGRVCDGYGIWAGWNQQAPFTSTNLDIDIHGPKSLTSHNMPVPLNGSTKEEQLYFDYFCRRTALKIPGVFESAFWEYLIFQSSSTEPAVLHAVVALASAHRSLETTSGNEVLRTYQPYFKSKNDPPRNAHDRFALQQYNKAICDLQSHLSDKCQASPNVALITCMMFICLELLRGEFKSANTHFQNALSILSQVRPRRALENTLNNRSDKETVDDYLIEAYARLNSKSAVFGLGSPPLYVLAQDLTCSPGSQFRIPSTFPTIYSARQYIDALLNRVLHLIEESRDPSLSSHQAISKLKLRQSTLDTHLTTYQTTLTTSTPTLLAHPTPRIILGLPILRIYHAMTSILLLTALSPLETAYDALTPLFASIITECENIEAVDLADLRIQYPSTRFCKEMNIRFTVDMGFIAPLWYVAVKCRDPGIRRRAVQFLGIAPVREGMWDPGVVAHVAQRVIDMEESDSFRDGDRGDKAAEEGMRCLPETKRLRDVKVVMSETERAGGTLVYMRWRVGDEGCGEWVAGREEFAFDQEGVPREQSRGAMAWGRCAAVQDRMLKRERGG